MNQKRRRLTYLSLLKVGFLEVGDEGLNPVQQVDQIIDVLRPPKFRDDLSNGFGKVVLNLLLGIAHRGCLCGLRRSRCSR